MKPDKFFDEVYQIVAKIPEGKVATYGQIAAMLGNPLAARTVGEAMRNAPRHLDLPCLRVVNKKGEMSPGYAFGGEGKQRKQLESEGISFNAAGCIEMNKFLWKKSEE